MITYLEPLFLTDVTARKLEKIKLSLKLGIGMVGVNLITISENEDDVFDIIPAFFFKQRIARNREYEYKVIGIAESRRAAYKLVESIIEDINIKTGSYENIRQYFFQDMING